ncbi:MAG TPA: lipase maturation factor family protein [Sandaracinaceae bacterium LLY-WYZ-13_1]|nr:lipase maturation factor family protein [Sandaracinaceae bacterium LLY-WYZ-13_1]
MDDPELKATLDRITGRAERPRHALVRFSFLRLMGFVYAFAFLGATQQLPGLIGPGGLLPADDHLARLRAMHGGTGAAFLERPTLFLLTGASDAALLAVAWVGLALGLAVLGGVTNAAVMAALWVLQLSLMHVGQVFWGYGWELLLLEAGFLAIVLCPLTSARPLPNEDVPRVLVWLLRWLAFRVMFGAGLIKIRGDPCWQELTCLAHHYETQPIPNPVSPLLHALPMWVHQAGVLFNHLVELVVPFFLFGPRRLRIAGGLLTVAFQAVLLVSGNLSFLNWLTIAVTLAAFDDRFLARVLPRRLAPPVDPPPPSKPRRVAVWAVAGLVLLLSVDPLMNLFAFDQRMNASFDRLHLVNTYGAFGSVGRVRHEVILEGTRDDPDDPDATWRAYALPCQPGDPSRAPCLRAPYHPRLDWQMWFAALSDYERQPWIVHLVHQLLTGEGRARELLAHDPFGDEPPRAVRASLYRYRFAPLSSDGWWERERVGDYLHALEADDPRLAAFVESYGWD